MTAGIVTAPPRPSHLGWGRAVLIAAAVAVAGLVALVIVLPRLVGGAALTVRTGSMAPAVHVGDLVIDRSVDAASVRPGDVVTYRQPTGTLVTHRVVAISVVDGRRVFTLRGDANSEADPYPVPADALRGRVWFTIPRLGLLTARLASVRTVLVAGGVVVLAGFAVSQFAAVARDRRRRP